MITIIITIITIIIIMIKTLIRKIKKIYYMTKNNVWQRKREKYAKYSLLCNRSNSDKLSERKSNKKI